MRQQAFRSGVADATAAENKVHYWSARGKDSDGTAVADCGTHVRNPMSIRWDGVIEEAHCLRCARLVAQREASYNERVRHEVREALGRLERAKALIEEWNRAADVVAQQVADTMKLV